MSSLRPLLTENLHHRMSPSGSRSSGRFLSIKSVKLKQIFPEYAHVVEILGGRFVSANCFDGKLRLCYIRGRLYKRVWIRRNDIILVSLRDFQDERADVIYKYNSYEARKVKDCEEIPEDIKLRRGVRRRNWSKVQICGKVHGSMTRPGKVREQTRKVKKQAKKKRKTGRAARRKQFNRRFQKVFNKAPHERRKKSVPGCVQRLMVLNYWRESKKQINPPSSGRRRPRTLKLADFITNDLLSHLR